MLPGSKFERVTTNLPDGQLVAKAASWIWVAADPAARAFRELVEKGCGIVRPGKSVFEQLCFPLSVRLAEKRMMRGREGDMRAPRVQKRATSLCLGLCVGMRAMIADWGAHVEGGTQVQPVSRMGDPQANDAGSRLAAILL